MTMERMNVFTQNFLSKGFSLDDARQKALSLLDHTVDVQAMVMAFGDTFTATATLVLVSLPLVFLLNKGQGAPIADAH
jgi:DHA2 family multidrug resistance protein